jgi:3-oxoacyl-[acyl-carrier protein] reductase
MFSLAGKRALVTGASRGIGRGIALALATQKADLAINYRSDPVGAGKVVAEVQKLGQEAFKVQADVSQRERLAEMFIEIKNRWGGLDILVNNAGILQMAPFEKITEEQWDQVLKVNLGGQFLCSQEAIKLMKKGGRIINIASIASGGVGIGSSQIAHYVASKGGVIALTESMAIDLAPKGINVNAVAPGMIETDMTTDLLADEKLRETFVSRIPKGRVGQPEDIGAAVAFLASDEADYINGAVLYVDGGWLAA